MSSVPSIATAAAVNAQGQVQLALAAKMAKMNAESQQSVVDLLLAASENIEEINKAAKPGLGANVDVSA